MIEDMIGKKIKSCRISDDAKVVHFLCETGEHYVMQHHRDCCEDVYLCDVCGDINDIMRGAEVTSAFENSNELRDDPDPPFPSDGVTWTFYTIATLVGVVTLRWVGSSNGYYSERVDFELCQGDMEIENV